MAQQPVRCPSGTPAPKELTPPQSPPTCPPLHSAKRKSSRASGTCCQRVKIDWLAIHYCCLPQAEVRNEPWRDKSTCTRLLPATLTLLHHLPQASIHTRRHPQGPEPAQRHNAGPPHKPQSLAPIATSYLDFQSCTAQKAAYYTLRVKPFTFALI